MLWKEPAPEHASHWKPTGIWPDEGQLAMVREHLESERPLLVLLDEARSPCRCCGRSGRPRPAD
ncbi:hypothetical protein NKH18_38685 [Streptomyces sp. M10(2022)]